MAEVTDEMLMAYADGALSALARAKVEAFLQANPEARRRVEMFRATGAPLSRLYARPMLEPVPTDLKDFVLNYKLGEEAGKAQPKRQSLTSSIGGLGSAGVFARNILRWLAEPAQACRWQLAAAAVASLALGVSVDAFMHANSSSSADLVAFRDGHLYASGALNDVLEKEVSGRQARIGGVRGEAVTMRANLTFKSKQNTYCREYEIATPSDGGFVGLGCRDHDGKWALEVHLPSSKPSKGGVKTAAAANNAALDAIVDRMIDGDAFGNDQEKSAISGGWK